MTVNGGYKNGLNNVINNFSKIDKNNNKMLSKKELDSNGDGKLDQSVAKNLNDSGEKYLQALLDNNGKLFNQLSTVEKEDKSIFGDSNVEGEVSKAELYTAQRGSDANNGKGKGFDGNALGSERLNALKDVESGVAKSMVTNVSGLQQAVSKDEIKSLMEYFVSTGTRGTFKGKAVPDSSNFRALYFAATDPKHHDAGSYEISSDRSSYFMEKLDTALTALGYPSAYANSDEQADALKDSFSKYMASRGIKQGTPTLDYSAWKVLVSDLGKAMGTRSVSFGDKDYSSKAPAMLDYFSDKGSVGITNGKLYPPADKMRPLYLSVVSPNQRDAGALRLYDHKEQVKTSLKVLGFYPANPATDDEMEIIKMGIKDLQEANGLPRAGYIGPGTWKAMVEGLHDIANPGQDFPGFPETD